MVSIALAQINQVVGDIDGNVARIAACYERAERAGAQILALPELAVTGYPPEDLLFKRSFVDANLRAVEEVAAKVGDVLTIVGFVDRGGRDLYNAAAICRNGRIEATYHKHLLPNYGVFDERRYFTEGVEHYLIDTPEAIIGVCVCEDAWFSDGPLISQGDAGAQMVIDINASPFHTNKLREREQMLCERAGRARSSIAYVNMVGAQDELVFDGGSLVIDPRGEVVARFPQFVEHFAVVDVPLGEARTPHADADVRRIELTLRPSSAETDDSKAEPLPTAREMYEALRVCLSDYARKNDFDKVVLGLSGGIDSSLTAALAADALGPENVLGVAMPSEFSSSHSLEDAKAVATNLGIEMLVMPIASTYNSYLKVLEETFGPVEMGLAEENLQARIRGNILFAISNRYGHLVLATGNKSEMAVGYATLYGDMAGGFAPLKDVFKTEVYMLCRARNEDGEVIPESVLTKAPSAELRPNQKDSDSLPPYEELDRILEGYIERDEAVADIVARGEDPATVEKVVNLVDSTEYKRRQAAPGAKVTTKAFGRDRRLPITNRWTDRIDPPR